MPEGLLQIVVLLSVGYLLLALEIFTPGGVLGFLGLVSVAYGCSLAFDLSTGWGLASVALSLAVTAAAIAVLVRTRAVKKMLLDGPGARGWTAAESGLQELVGRRGRTLTSLRPAGLAEIDDRRIDVVADADFLDAGTEVRVSEVEGNRVVVEAAGPEA